MSIQHRVSLLEFCLKNTYFLFQGKFYEQVHGAAMGFPISPLIANLFMEEFEVKALSSCPHPSTLWLRSVDDTFVIIRTEHNQPLCQHINNQDHHIQFTVEELSQGTLPILDTLVTKEPNNTFSTSIYRKPTHRPIFTLGQQSFYNSQTKCIQHIGKQGQNSLIQPGSLVPGTAIYQEGPTGLSISKLGT